MANRLVADTYLRTAGSLAISIHLLVVAAGLYGSMAPGRDGDRNLKERLRGVVTPYTQLLNFDSTARFALTHATGEDVDCRIEFLPAGDNPDENSQWVAVEKGWRGTDCRLRYQRLSEILAGYGDSRNDDGAAVVATAICEHLALQLGTDVQQIRCTRRLLQEPGDVDGSNLDRRNPSDSSYVVEVYRAEPIRIGGRLQMRRVGTRGQEAPVVRSKATP